MFLVACGSDGNTDKDGDNTDATVPTPASDAAATASQGDAVAPRPDGAVAIDSGSSGAVVADSGVPAQPPVGTDAGTPVVPVDNDAGVTPVVPVDAAVITPVLTADQMLEAGYSKKFLQCSGLNGGTLPADYFTVDDEYARCIANCVLADTCENIGTWFCGGGATTGKGTVYTCTSKCPLAPTDGFACGDGKTIPHAYVCDVSSQLDCKGKQDEASCPMDFVCGSGEHIPMRLRCDGTAACKDGSDEPAECAHC